MRAVVVAPGDVDLLARAHEELLTPSFAPEELVDLPTLADDVAGGVSEVLLAVSGDGDDGPGSELHAVGVWDRSPGAPFGLLSYLAARPGGRSRGVGGILLEAMLERWRGPGGPAAVLGEVHDPAEWPATADERPVDRLRFYARHGSSVLDVPWVQPRVAPELDRVAGMLLIVLTARSPALVVEEGAEGLDGALLRAWMAEQITRAEGPDGIEDPQFGPSLRAADRAVVPLRSIEIEP